MKRSGQQHPSILITGGAGYIGSHLTLLLQQHGYRVAAYDNLSSGNRWAVAASALIEADILDTPTLLAAMREHHVTTVIHLAAKSSVPESFAEPDAYFKTNAEGTASVVEACAEAGVKQLLFSSTAAVYGNATHGLVTETAPLDPISPYGKSKLEAERIVAERCSNYGIRQITFRYFNVIGAHPDGLIGQSNRHSEQLFQKCLDCLRDGSSLNIFGNDYDTPDGTAERDYIHVQDLASLHLQALRYLECGGASQLLNAGYGNAHTVLAFVRAFSQVTGKAIDIRYAPRRTGDPASLIADVSRLGRTLDWKPEFTSLTRMIGTGWAWENSPQRKSAA